MQFRERFNAAPPADDNNFPDRKKRAVANFKYICEK